MWTRGDYTSTVKFAHEDERRRSLQAVRRSLSDSSRVSCRGWTVFDEQKRSRVLRFRSVLIDQCLKSRIASQRVPNGIEFPERDGDSSGHSEQVVEKLKRVIDFAGTSIDYSESKRDFWPSQSILGLGQKLDRTFAFGDRRFLLTEASENLTKQHVPRGAIRTFAQRSLCDQPSFFKGSTCLLFIIQVTVNYPFVKRPRLGGRPFIKFVHLLHDGQSLWEFSLHCK